MTPRSAAFAAAVILVGLGALAAWLVGVPLPVIGGGTLVALVISWRRAYRRRRAMPAAGAPERPPDPPATGH